MRTTPRPTWSWPKGPWPWTVSCWAPAKGGGATGKGSFARTTISLEQALAWTDGRLVFLDTPLAEVASRLARWYDVEVTLASPGLGALRVTGSFRDEPANAVLDAITRSLGLRLVRGESGYQLTRG